MSTSGIEVRRPYPSVATIWVAELLAAANKQVDDVENRKTYESINKMFGKTPSNQDAAPMSLEEKFTHRINKQKRKLQQKEKEVENVVKKKKKKVDTIPNTLSKTEIVTMKKKAATIVNGKGTKVGCETNSMHSVENIKLRLEKDTLSRSARKKLRRKLKGILNKSNESVSHNEEGERKNITSNNLNVGKVKKSINNYHKVAPSTPKMNGHHIEIDTTPNTVTKNNKSDKDINNKKQNFSQKQTNQEACSQKQTNQEACSQKKTNQEACSQKQINQEACSQKQTNQEACSQKKTTQEAFSQKQTNQEAFSQKQTNQEACSQKKTTQEACSQKQTNQEACSQKQTNQEASAIILKKRKKKRSKQKNLKKDNRPDHLKPSSHQDKGLGQNKV